MKLLKKNKYVFLLAIMLLLLNTSLFSQSISKLSSIKIIGNTKTKNQVIYRELTFNIGDSLTEKQLTNKIFESKKNLVNTPLFNFVNISYKKDSINNYNITIELEERWYLWPQASIYYADRNLSNWLKNNDLSRTDFGIGLTKYNFRGRNEKISLFSVFGYNKQFILQYKNVFFDKKRHHSASFFVNYLRRRETGFIIKNDKVNQIKLDSEYALKSINFNFNYSYRKKIYNKHSFIIGFENRKLSDSLLKSNPLYLTNSALKVNYFYFKYIFLKDKRNFRIMPTKGYYLKFTLGKYGLFLFPENDINMFYIKNEFSKYTEVTERLSFSNNLTLRYKTKKNQAYFLNTALGYSSNIRGYEYYVINGSSYALTKHNLNYKLLSKKVIHLKKLPFTRFNKINFTIYTSFFADFAYVKNTNTNYLQNNNLANTLLYSQGISLYIITYYDLFLRLDFTRNHLKENGFYFHLEAPF